MIGFTEISMAQFLAQIFVWKSLDVGMMSVIPSWNFQLHLTSTNVFVLSLHLDNLAGH